MPSSSAGTSKVKELKPVERIKRGNLSHNQTVHCFTTVGIKMHSTGAIIDKQSPATEESWNRPSTFKNLINYQESRTSKWGRNALGQLAIGKKIKLDSHPITIY